MNYQNFDGERIVSALKKLTRLPAVKITASKKGHVPLLGSKFGGVPYWNPREPYPVGANGKKLVLLAQLNMAEVPELDGFPSDGILQFFIASGGMYGLNFDCQTSQESWRVVYHSSIIDSVSEEDVLSLGVPVSCSLGEDEKFPFYDEYALSFKKTDSFLGIQSYDRFILALKEACRAEGLSLPDDFDPYELFDESFINAVSNFGAGHWLGGYPLFVQEDPRPLGHECDMLLFQIDSDNEGDVDIMWGDMGTANFFISRDALVRRDFSKVMYNWDCC